MYGERRPWPVLLAASGAAGLLISLWLHWYAFTIPTAAIDQAEQMAGQFGALAPLIHQSAVIARNLGELHLTAWQALQQIDIVLAGLAGVAGAVALMSAATRAGAAVALAGVAALGLCGYRTIVPPGPSGLLHPATGAYLALACCMAIILGGFLLGDREAAPSAPSWEPETASSETPPSLWSTTGSVAPPRN
jgi:hypothetical protein